MEKRGLTQALSAQGVTNEHQIGFSDEFRVGLYGCKRRVLAPRGVKVRQRIELTRDWYDLAILVDGRAGRLEWDWIEGTKAEQILPAVEDWIAHDVEVLVWDRRTSHGAKVIADTGVVLIEQPALSPELNPAERVGEVIRDATDGKVYGTIWAKMAAVEAVLEELAADPERVIQLTGWDWIIDSCDDLPP